MGSTSQAKGKAGAKVGDSSRSTTNQYGWSRVTRTVKLGDRDLEVAGAIAV